MPSWDEIIDLTLGVPGYGPPDVVSELLGTGAGEFGRGYAPPAGLPLLRAAVARKLRDRNNLPAVPDEVVVTSGAAMGIFATLLTVTSPGDKVLLPDPGFPLYKSAAKMLSLRIATYRTDDGLGCGPDWSRISREAAGARVLVWNNPHNPLGYVAQHPWVKEILAVVEREPNLYLIDDQAYEDLVLEGQHVSTASLQSPARPRIISVFSLSKGYSLCGWRIGYLHASATLAEAIATSHWSATMSASSVSQLVAVACLAATPPDYHSRVRSELLANRRALTHFLSSRALRYIPPRAGVFVWVDVSSTGFDGEAICNAFLDNCGVTVSPGISFSDRATDFVRISFAPASNRLEEALSRLAQSWSRVVGPDTKDPVSCANS